MREGWAKKRLLDITTKIGSGATPRGGKNTYKESGISFFRSLNVHDGEFKEKNLAFIDDVQGGKLSNVIVNEGDILFNITGASIARCCVAPKRFLPARVNQHVAIIRPKPEFANIDYLAYYLVSKESKDALLWHGEKAGATRQALTKTQLQDFNILLPPIPEQKCIVTILDEAFKGIDKAIANTEKNLANARELFESYLNNIFTQKGEEWIETQLENICSIKHGFAFKSKFFAKEGGYVLLTPGSFYESGGYREQRKKTKYYVGEIPEGYILKKGDFLFAMTEQAVGLLGSSLIVPESNCFLHNQRLGLVQVANEIEWNNDFFFHQFNTKRFRTAVQESASGLKVRHTSPKKLGAVSICFPPTKAEQKAVADKLNRLWVETQRIEMVFRQKLMDLAELKQSLLQKAFSGELTSTNKVVAFPDSKVAKDADPFSPEFAAKILAFAYHHHAAKKRHNTFGHVKAQKTLHLVESIAGIDLDRHPIKDAAGPNDFQHMRKAEAWAKEQQFFEFVSRGEDKGYDFKKLVRYDEMMAGLFATIKPYQQRLEQVIDLIIPKKSLETGLIANVHAAWNNLILDGCKITDKAIIREARENWHPDKMKIPVAEFQQALRFIRDKGIIPDGKAKRVTGQENLF